LERKRTSRLFSSTVASVSGMATARKELASAIGAGAVKQSLESVTKPKSLSGGMKKAGLLLVASPDPITDIPGIALLASSFIVRKREPAGLNHLLSEARKVVREIQSLGL
jgi:hypothetical protein